MLSAECFADAICWAAVSMAHSPTDQASVERAAGTVSGPQAFCGGLLVDGRHRWRLRCTAGLRALDRDGADRRELAAHVQ